MANKEMINDKALFAVPLSQSKARDLLLDAVIGSRKSVTGHSDDTSDIQPPASQTGATETKVKVSDGG